MIGKEREKMRAPEGKAPTDRPWMSVVVVSWKPRYELEGAVSGGGWWAKTSWSCGRFSQSDMMQGEIGTRHPTGLRVAIDQVLAMAERLGVKPVPKLGMALFVEGDGEDDVVMLPDGWRRKLAREAARRGWYGYKETA